MYNIDMLQVQLLVNNGKIMWTEHVATRLRERGIKRADVIECIENGEIIEQYPDDTPFPSCLILGNCEAGEPLHIVVGLNINTLCCIITAYRPDSDKWESDFKTRKEGK